MLSTDRRHARALSHAITKQTCLFFLKRTEAAITPIRPIDRGGGKTWYHPLSHAYLLQCGRMHDLEEESPCSMTRVYDSGKVV